VGALAALAYCWQVGATIEIYYAAAVRSMSQSWHDFLLGAFDPAGTISVDKLPGALWVQALSVRLFGYHEWAIMLPQAVEAALTVLVLFHAVRRLAGLRQRSSPRSSSPPAVPPSTSTGATSPTA